MICRSSLNVMRCNNALRLTAPLSFPKLGQKLLHKSNNHRMPRKQPWWSGVAVLGCSFIFVNLTAVGLYFGNRWYQSWRPAGDTLAVSSKIDEKVFSRPDLAVVAVRVVFHHVLSNSKTPFGCPIVAPLVYQDEVEQLCNFVWQLHQEHPNYSIPDIWSLLTARALSRLSGPHVETLRGRKDESEHGLTRKTMVQFTKSLVPETSRNILELKRALSPQHLSLGEVVALIGCNRALGFHDAAAFHTNKEVNVAKWLKRKELDKDSMEKVFELPDDTRKCTPDPYIFSNYYYNLLLDYNWKQPGRWTWWKHDNYRCSQHDRHREVRLIDPIATRKDELRQQWAARKEAKHSNNNKPFRERLLTALTPVESSNLRIKRKNGSVKDENNDNDDEENNARRSGEAQAIPGIEELIKEEEKRWQRATQFTNAINRNNQKEAMPTEETKVQTISATVTSAKEDESVYEEECKQQQQEEECTIEKSSDKSGNSQPHTEKVNTNTIVNGTFWNMMHYIRLPQTSKNTALNEDATAAGSNTSSSSSYDPCLHISMQPIDISLLDDALTYGWVYHYGNNEPDFYSAVSDLILTIQARGHNRNNLYYEF